jgi:hypothetical protein
MNTDAVPRRRIRALASLSTFAILASGAASAQECVQLPRGVISWWPGDEDRIDLIGGHDAVDAGATPSSFAPGRVGYAFDFQGFDTRLQVDHHPDLDFSLDDEFSIVFWMRTPRVNENGQLTIVNKWNGSQATPYAYTVNITPDPQPRTGTVWAASWDGSTQPIARTDRVLDDDAFHHIAAVFRHPERRIEVHVDGSLDATRVYETDLTAIGNDDPLYFGMTSVYSSTDYIGLLDEVMIFGRALSTCEIRSLYEAGGQGVCRGDVDEDGVADYEDNCPDAANELQDDVDLDGVGDTCDCSALNPAFGIVPPEVCALEVGADGDDDRLSWVPLAELSGSGTVYDVLSGRLDELPVGTGPSELCLQDDLGGSITHDSSVLDPGEGIWFLVRGDSLCGDGTWGDTSSGIARISPACL